MENIKGILIVKVLKGVLTRDTELIGSMAPFCVIKVGNQSYKTTAKKGAGKAPEWFEVFSFFIKLDEEVKITVMDKELIGKDDLVGNGSFINKKEFINMKYSFWVNLIHKNLPAGKVQIDVEFIPDKESMDVLHVILQKYLEEKISQLKIYQGDKKEEIKEFEQSPEDLNSKEQTSKRINELEQQINQVNIDFQTKLKDINTQVDVLQKTASNLQIDTEKKKKEIFKYEQIEWPGTFRINIFELCLERDVGGMFDKMDPYILVSIGMNVQRTKTKKDAGKKAEYNEELLINRTKEEEIGFEVFDENEGKDDKIIAYAYLSVNQFIFAPIIEKTTLKLSYKGKNAGYLNIGIEFKEKN